MDERKYRLLIEAGFSKKIVDHLSEFQDAYACRTPLQKAYHRISNAISRLFY